MHHALVLRANPSERERARQSVAVDSAYHRGLCFLRRCRRSGTCGSHDVCRPYGCGTGVRCRCGGVGPSAEHRVGRARERTDPHLCGDRPGRDFQRRPSFCPLCHPGAGRRHWGPRRVGLRGAGVPRRRAGASVSKKRCRRGFAHGALGAREVPRPDRARWSRGSGSKRRIWHCCLRACGPAARAALAGGAARPGRTAGAGGRCAAPRGRASRAVSCRDVGGQAAGVSRGVHVPRQPGALVRARCGSAGEVSRAGRRRSRPRGCCYERRGERGPCNVDGRADFESGARQRRADAGGSVFGVRRVRG